MCTCMCMFVCMCVYVYMYEYVYVHVHVYVYVYVYVYVHVLNNDAAQIFMFLRMILCEWIHRFRRLFGNTCGGHANG